MSFQSLERRMLVLVAVALSITLFGGVALAAGPYLVVAGSGDNLVTAIDMGTQGYPIAGSTHIGQQALGVATVSGKIAISDFLGGAIHVLSAQKVGNYLGVSAKAFSTTPDLVNPEGITPLGKNGWALVSDGVSQAGGNDVGLTLIDITNARKLSSVLLPSVYAVAFDPRTWTAYAMDGINSSVAVIKVTAAGQLVDTGVRIPTWGPATQARFITLDGSGTRLFVSYKLVGAVEAIDIAPTAVTPDGTKALVADYGTSQWIVLDISGSDGMPVDTGTRIASPYGVPNTFSGTRTFTFWNDLLCFSATNSSMAVALNWKTLTMTDMAVPVGLTPAGMDMSY